MIGLRISPRLVNALKAAVILILVLVLTIRGQAQDDSTEVDHYLYVSDVAWSSDGSMIAAVGIKTPPDVVGYLRVIEVQSGQVIYQLDPSPGAFSSVDWSPNDRFIAAGGYDQVVWVIDIEARRHVTTLWGHRSTVTDVDWNADGTQLVSSGNWDDLIILWDMTTYEQRRVVEVFSPWTIAFSPNDQQIAVGAGGGIRIFPSTLDVGSGREQAPYRSFTSAIVGSLVWSRDGSQIAFGTQVFPNIINPDDRAYAEVYLIDSQSGRELSHFQTQDESIYGIVWSPDGRLIATHSLNGMVRIWDASSGAELASYPGMTRYNSDLSFSPYGGRLAFGAVVPLDVTATAVPTLSSVPGEVQTLADGAVQIVVPVPSFERLQAIAELCHVPPDLLQTLTQNDAEAFVTTVQTLPADDLPPGCAADLLAVANALLTQEP